jgi:hypothetical protein
VAAETSRSTIFWAILTAIVAGAVLVLNWFFNFLW